MKITEENAIAVHEAGHTTAVLVLNLKFDYVSIVRDELIGGELKRSNLDYTFNIDSLSRNETIKNREKIKNDMLIDFAGASAEEKFAGSYCYSCSSSDLTNSLIKAEFIDKHKSTELLTEQSLKAKMLFTDEYQNDTIYWGFTLDLAELLVKKKILRHTEVWLMYNWYVKSFKRRQRKIKPYEIIFGNNSVAPNNFF